MITPIHTHITDSVGYLKAITLDPTCKEYLDSLNRMYLYPGPMCIDSLFTWISTPQGRDYWGRLHHKACILDKEKENWWVPYTPKGNRLPFPNFTPVQMDNMFL